MNGETDRRIGSQDLMKEGYTMAHRVKDLKTGINTMHALLLSKFACNLVANMNRSSACAAWCGRSYAATA